MIGTVDIAINTHISRNSIDVPTEDKVLILPQPLLNTVGH